MANDKAAEDFGTTLRGASGGHEIKDTGPPPDIEMAALKAVWEAVCCLDEKALYRVTNYVESRHQAARDAAKKQLPNL